MNTMKTLKKGRIVQYFSADIAKGLFNGLIANYLLYFYQPTIESGLPSLIPDNKLLGFITIMALLTGCSKIVDAITDPLVANWSDKLKSPYGRRMPFLRFAAIPYALSVIMIFLAPFSEGSVGNAIWVGFFLISYYVFYTMYFIPHRALVPEIIPDSNQRVGYYAISTVFFMGSSALMYAATLFVGILKDSGLSPLSSFRIVFGVFAAVGMFFLLLAAFSFKEQDYVKKSNRPTDSIFKSFAIVFKNKDFVVFSIADLASYISMAFFQTTLLYYITVLIKIPEDQSFFVMLAAIVTAILCFPLILKISKIKGKKILLVIGSAMFAVLFTLIFFGDKIVALMTGYELVLGILMGVAVAFPFAAINILPQAVLADIIQAESLKTGINREGIFSAIKTFIEKIAYAIAISVVSIVLAVGAPEGELVGLQGVKLTGLIAGIFCIISTIFYSLYNNKRVMQTIEQHSNVLITDEDNPVNGLDNDEIVSDDDNSVSGQDNIETVTDNDNSVSGQDNN